ncbi:HD domain-containing protein [Streptomyces sp. NPDC001380]|uniref:HD domain-containing protein n=1 Tax=Streptomyces sp. NPDC001380 TaxID=3364566 RepID=UPI0036AC02E4
MSFTLADADALAERAHRGQTDKIGEPYVAHVRAVAHGVAPFGTGLAMAGLLHDTLEDTDLTADDLLAAGVPSAVVALVERLTHDPAVPYEEMVRRVAGDYAAALVKIADNAHNALAERAGRLSRERREQLAAKYGRAREILWHAVPRADVEAVVRRVNPALLGEGAGDAAAR